MYCLLAASVSNSGFSTLLILCVIHIQNTSHCSREPSNFKNGVDMYPISAST